MFQHPSHTAQFATDHRLARRADAARRRTRRTSNAPDRLAAVGEHVAAVGLDDARASVDAALTLARRRGVGTSLVAIVADPTQPNVARERALGRLLVVLAADQAATRAAEPAA